MNEKFILSCESTIDLPYSYTTDNNISLLFYSYLLDGQEIEDNMGRNKKIDEVFYKKLKEGHIPSTSQINEFKYLEYFESLCKSEKQILHIAFGSGMTPSVNNAISAAKIINEKLGMEKITVIDSTCSSGGYGMIVSFANDIKNNGGEIKEAINKVMGLRYNIHHQFFVTDMSCFKHSGRVSGTAATVATILGICPIMRLNDEGRIIAYDKVRGKQAAINKTVKEMLNHAENGSDYDGKCFINHSNCYDLAIALKMEIEKLFPKLKDKVEIYNIGNIIASHCGAGTVALFFVGDKRI